MSKVFNSEAVPKCFDRLGKAKGALQKCRGASNFRTFATHWSDFLIHTGGVLNLLDAGSKDTPQGRQWYGGIKRAGRADPLVAYMHQARNVEEHSVHTTTANAGPYIGIGGPKEDMRVSDLNTSDLWAANDPVAYIRERAWRTNDGLPPTIVHHTGGPHLRSVTDQFKTHYQPPSHHKNKAITKHDPISVGELYLAYLEELVAKAGEMA